MHRDYRVSFNNGVLLADDVRYALERLFPLSGPFTVEILRARAPVAVPEPSCGDRLGDSRRICTNPKGHTGWHCDGAKSWAPEPVEQDHDARDAALEARILENVADAAIRAGVQVTRDDGPQDLAYRLARKLREVARGEQ